MPPNEVHIWRAHLDLDSAALNRLSQLLNPAERERAARFHFERHRHRFIAARAFLRQILAAQLNADPGALEFDYNPNGKPRLAGPFANSPLRFNLSHSEALALYAFAEQRETGVDLEFVKQISDMDGVARHAFSPAECDELKKSPESERLYLFFRYWTRREAMVKCSGAGITEMNSNSPFQGSVADLAPAPGYFAAVAVERGTIELASFMSTNPVPGDSAPSRIH